MASSWSHRSQRRSPRYKPEPARLRHLYPRAHASVFRDESRVESQLAPSGAQASQRVAGFIVGSRLAQHRPATHCAGSRLCALRTIYRGRTLSQDSDIHVSMSRKEHYRADGVRIQHDPYASGMAEKYGRPGETDADGFDPYAGRVCA